MTKKLGYLCAWMFCAGIFSYTTGSRFVIVFFMVAVVIIVSRGLRRWVNNSG